MIIKTGIYKHKSRDFVSPQEFANTIKSDPKDIIKWARREIKAYEKLIKILEKKKDMTPKEQPTWQQRKEELREKFESLFPKDESAFEGGEASKSNRSAGLMLWAEFEILLREAIEQERRKEEYDVDRKKYVVRRRETD